MPSVPRYSWLSMAVWLSHVCHFTNVRVRGKLHMQTLSPHGACSNRFRRYKCLRSTYASDIETFIVLYCIVLYCIVLYDMVLYCIVLYCIALYCTVLRCAELYCKPDRFMCSTYNHTCPTSISARFSEPTYQDQGFQIIGELLIQVVSCESDFQFAVCDNLLRPQAHATSRAELTGSA